MRNKNENEDDPTTATNLSDVMFDVQQQTSGRRVRCELFIYA